MLHRAFIWEGFLLSWKMMFESEMRRVFLFRSKRFPSLSQHSRFSDRKTGAAHSSCSSPHSPVIKLARSLNNCKANRQNIHCLSALFFWCFRVLESIFLALLSSFGESTYLHSNSEFASDSECWTCFSDVKHYNYLFIQLSFCLHFVS